MSDANDHSNKPITPRHVAIIMDGNGRWAQKRGKPRLFGHQEGARRVRDIVMACPIKQHTEATEMDRETILEKIGTAARDGFAFVENEFEPGAAGLAVSIPDIGNRQAVVATADTVNQFSKPEEMNRSLDILRRAALGFRS